MYLLFFEQHGYDLQDMFICQSVHSAAAFLMEVPSGYVGDRFTRKKSLLLGSIITAIGFFTYYLSNDLYFFVVAAFLTGTGTSFISGSDSAMLYDTLLELKREDEYLKLEGRVSAFGNFAEAIAALIGGLIAVIVSIKANLFVQGVLLVVAFLLILSCKEPSVVQEHQRKSFSEALKSIINEMKNNKRFLHIMLFSSFMGVNTLLFAWSLQAYFKDGLGWSLAKRISINELINSEFTQWKDNGIAWILTWMSLNIIVGVFAMKASSINRLISKKALVIILVSVLVLPYFFLYSHIQLLIVLGFFVFYAGRGIVTPLFREWINQSVGSEVRATALSIRAFMFRVMFVVLGPTVGYVAGLYSIETAFVLLGIIFFFLSIPYLYFTFSK